MTVDPCRRRAQECRSDDRVLFRASEKTKWLVEGGEGVQNASTKAPPHPPPHLHLHHHHHRRPPPPTAQTTALLTANFYPNCPSTNLDRDIPKNYDPSPSLSFTHSPDDSPNFNLDVTSHLDISSTTPLRPNTCVGLPIPLEYSSLFVDHFSVSAGIQHPRPLRHGGPETKETCKITVHETPGCGQDPVLEVPVGEGDRRVESGCVRREFLAFELVWAKLSCEVEVIEEDEEEKKPWTHGGLANSSVPVSHGAKKGRLSGGKRRTKLPIF
ncbi:hypothetical protein P170DRAFT_462256 [Aspergillus steynii IBT 23096]|uniref:Uncharacterized protein n=1 Tax=Aspergillus steynii IBT 23096 TaxID=1392250 RepID=A0A2I2GHB7_9EURO|nr:uncharacterized protein P170DRAFT_462256 [Aspergillus steynii IBT 23096]PLB52264.1 hypothetical protein P170DRAFT_462256 [Aspergillus steynii IBT 23096]